MGDLRSRTPNIGYCVHLQLTTGYKSCPWSIWPKVARAHDNWSIVTRPSTAKQRVKVKVPMIVTHLIHPQKNGCSTSSIPTLNTECHRGRQLQSLVWPDRGSNPQPTNLWADTEPWDHWEGDSWDMTLQENTDNTSRTKPSETNK